MYEAKSPTSNRSSFHEDSTLKRSTPTPKTMIRQKPPPKPPRMKPTQLDESLQSESNSPPRDASPGIISLKSSIVDATRTLDSPISLGGAEDRGDYGGAGKRTTRLSPAKNSHQDYWQNILEQIKPFAVLQTDIGELLSFICGRGSQSERKSQQWTQPTQAKSPKSPVANNQQPFQFQQQKSTTPLSPFEQQWQLYHEQQRATTTPTTPTIDPGLQNGDSNDPKAVWGRLVAVVVAREEEGRTALCDALRHFNHPRLADLLIVLDRLLHIGIASDTKNTDAKTSDDLCPVCRFKHENPHSEDVNHEVSKFDVEIICIDSETGQVRPLKELSETKKTNRKLALSPTDRLMFKNDYDRYIPGISVSVFNQCFCNQGLAQLAELLQQYSSIRELHIVKNQLDLVSIETLFQSMSRNQTLQKLDVRLNSLDDACAAKLFTLLSGNMSLRTINVASTNLTASGLNHLLSAFSSSKCLAELDVGFNNIGNTGAKAVSQALAANCPLRRLRLRSNNITADGAKHVFQALRRNSRLLYLDLSVNRLRHGGGGDAEGCTHISTALLANRTLKELNLEDCGVGKAGCELLARALKTNTTLRRLDLSRNPLGDDGVAALAEGVKYNQVLDSLSLNMCHIANPGFSTLMDALQYNTTMTMLKLCYNLIGYPVEPLSPTDEDPTPTVQEIYERVCQILQTNKDLKVLLWGNRLDYDLDNDLDLNVGSLDNNGHNGSAPSRSLSTSDNRPNRQLSEGVNGITLDQNTYAHVNNNNVKVPEKPKRAFSEASVPRSVSTIDKQSWLYQ